MKKNKPNTKARRLEIAKTCYCHTCKKELHYLGVAKHRAMHRNKKQDCKITYTHGDTYEYAYSKKE